MSACPTCSRPRWDGGGPITRGTCSAQGGDVCVLVMRLNNVCAALESLLSDEDAQREFRSPTEQVKRRTARAILEHTRSTP